MHVKKLLDALEGIAAIVEAAGAKSAAKDIRAVKQLFDQGKDRSAESALNELGQILDSETGLIRANYVNRLLEAGTIKSKFDVVCGALDKDKSVDKKLADTIADGYLNKDREGRKSWPNRKAAIDAIRRKFEERAYQEGKMRIVEKYKLT